MSEMGISTQHQPQQGGSMDGVEGMNRYNPEVVAAEMPRYQCHKKVWALKIKSIERDADKARVEGRETDGSVTITPEESLYAPFKVPHSYVRKHDPKAGGYYVVYEDGYESFSPAGAFESGYTRI